MSKISPLLFITLEFPPDIGGVGRMYREICRALRPQNVIVWAPPVARDQSIQAAGSSDDEYVVVRAPMLGKLRPRWIRTTFRLYRFLKQNKTRHIIVGQILPLGTAVWLLSFFVHIRYYVFIHGLDVTSAIQLKRKQWLIRMILKRASAILAANAFVGRVAKNLGQPDGKIEIIYPSPIITKISNSSSVNNLLNQYQLKNKPILLTIGRLVERKGHDVVLNALERVWREAPELNYYIIGDGPNRAKLKVLKSNLSRANQVKLLGETSDEETAAWLSLATIFIMTPRALANGDVEGLGIVYLEAASFGKPVIASRTGGVPEAVIDGVTGIIVNENNIDETAAAILKLLKDQNLRKRLGDNGRKMAAEKFSPITAARQIMRLVANQ